jgi:drug/metabolite transporter (DMT)-like permease
MLGIGALVALHWISFFGSIKLSNVSVCLATISITPLFSAFLEPLFYRKKIVLHEVVLGLLVIVGLSTIFSFETEYVLGMSLAVLAAFLAALFTVLNGLMIRTHRATVISTWEMLGGAVTAAVFILISRGEIASAFVFEGWDALYLAVLAVVCTAVAFVVSVEVMKVISPFTVNISISMEPVYSILLALWIFGEEERMSGGFYIGATIILLSVIGNAYWKHRIRKKEEKLASE